MNKSNFLEGLLDFLENDQLEEMKVALNTLCVDEREFLNKYLWRAVNQEDWEIGTLMTICYKLGRLMTNKLKKEIYVN